MKKYFLMASLFGVVAIFGAASFILQVSNNTTIVHTADIADFRDDRALVGASHDVLIGKVLKRDRTITLGDNLPATVFQVEVMDRIKGDKKGTIEVVQVGGCAKDQCIIMSGDIAHENNSSDDVDRVLLVPGSTYILFFRHDDTYGNILIPNIAGKVLVSSDGKKVQENNRHREIKKAYTEEIVFEGDVKLGWDKNSFSKLSPDEKKRVLSEIKDMR